MRAVLLLSIATIGCTWPSHAFREEGDAAADTIVEDVAPDASETAVEDGSPDAPTEMLPDPTMCAPSMMATACDVLRSLTPTVALDGKGDEFCDLAWRSLTLSDADRTIPSPPPSGLATSAEIRAGLSSFGVHVFVQVTDPSVVTDLVDYTQGDAVEIFLRGSKTPLNGDLESDLARAIVIVPPTATTSGRAASWVHGKKGPSLDASQWAARRVKGGWEAELHYPWSALMNEASPGQVMGFDVALDVKDEPSAKTRAVRAVLHEEVVTDSPACTTFGFSTPDALCDDRLWCLVKAYVP